MRIKKFTQIYLQPSHSVPYPSNFVFFNRPLATWWALRWFHHIVVVVELLQCTEFVVSLHFHWPLAQGRPGFIGRKLWWVICQWTVHSDSLWPWRLSNSSWRVSESREAVIGRQGWFYGDSSRSHQVIRGSEVLTVAFSALCFQYFLSTHDWSHITRCFWTIQVDLWNYTCSGSLTALVGYL